MKTYLINGNTKGAQIILERWGDVKDFKGLIRDKYLSLVSFIHNDFEKSLNYLERSIINFPLYYQEVCPLLIFNLLALKNFESFHKNFLQCSYFNKKKSPTQELFGSFFDRNLNLTSKESKNKFNELSQSEYLKMLLEQNSIENDEVKIILKLALLFNLEKDIKESIYSFSPLQMADIEIRELVASLFYRLDEKNLSLIFLDNVKSFTSSNIKGSIELKNNSQEIAYTHFKMALKDRPNSLNALEKILPLSIILKRYDETLQYLNFIPKKTFSPLVKLGLLGTLHTLQGNFPQAENYFEQIKKNYNAILPPKISLVASYLYSLSASNNELEIASDNPCKYYYGINCWYLIQSLIWPKVSDLYSEEKSKLTPVSEKELEEFNFENLTKSDIKDQPASIQHLEQKIFVNQKEIEELDDAQFKLTY